MTVVHIIVHGSVETAPPDSAIAVPAWLRMECACSIEGLRAETSDSAAERARLTMDLAEARA